MFPGRITARNTATGTRISDTVNVTGCPTPTADSSPI